MLAQFSRFIVYFPTVSGNENYYRVFFDSLKDAIEYAISNKGNIYDRKTGKTFFRFSEISGV